MRAGRQLQHRRTLALAQAREQHHLPIGKLQRIVMGHGIVHVDLPETREALSDLLVRKDADAEGRLAFDILVEGDLGARQQADRDVGFADRGEPARTFGRDARGGVFR